MVWGAIKQAAASVDPTTDKGLTNLGVGGVVGGGLGSNAIQSTIDSITGKDAADAAKEAAATAAQAEREKLEYLKDINKLPQAFLEAGLQKFGAFYGIGFDPETGETTSIDPTMPTQAERIALAESSPYYAAIMSGAEAGQRAIARTESATGGLRGGGTVGDIADFTTDLQNQALTTAYNEQLAQEQREMQGLGTLMGQQTYGTQIGQTIGDIGTTLAQGKIAAAQAQSQAMGNILNLGGKLGETYFSDARLKDDISLLGPTADPRIFYYEWTWNEEAESLGKKGKEKGYIAQEVEDVWPELVINGPDGYKRILKEQVEKRLKEIN